MYTAAVIRPGKEKGTYQLTLSHKRDGWEGSSNFITVVPVSGVFVVMNLHKPIAVVKDLDGFSKMVEEKYKVKPIIEK